MTLAEKIEVFKNFQHDRYDMYHYSICVCGCELNHPCQDGCAGLPEYDETVYGLLGCIVILEETCP